MPRIVASAATLAGALALGLVATGCSPAPPAVSERVAAFQKLPDWSGIWEPAVFVGKARGDVERLRADRGDLGCLGQGEGSSVTNDRPAANSGTDPSGNNASSYQSARFRRCSSRG